MAQPLSSSKFLDNTLSLLQWTEHLCFSVQRSQSHIALTKDSYHIVHLGQIQEKEFKCPALVMSPVSSLFPPTLYSGRFLEPHNKRDKVTPNIKAIRHRREMANRGRGNQASGRRSSLTNFNNADIIRRMNEVNPDQSPGSDFTTTFDQTPQPPLWRREGFNSPEEFESFMAANNERLQQHMFHNVQAQSSSSQPSRNLNVTSTASTNQPSSLTRQPSKAKHALKSIYTKAKDKTAKFVDEALLSPGHPDASYPNALPPKNEVQISLPLRGETWDANLRNATSNDNSGRTLLPINEAQDLRRHQASYAGEHWNQTNFAQDKNGVERQRVKSTKELKAGLLNGTVAYVGGSKLDFMLDSGAGIISHKHFADKNRDSAFFQGKHQPGPSRPPTRPTQAGPSQASSSAQASRTLPTVPVNHSAVDAKKPAPQAKIPRRKVESTWGALIEAANKSPSNSSEETLTAAPIAESSERARRRRVTVINSQAFDPVDPNARPGTRDSFAEVGRLDDSDEAFNFSSPPSPLSRPSSDLAVEAPRLESIDLGDRFAPFDRGLQIDTHIRDDHVSWYVRNEGASSSRQTRQERTDGIPSPTAPSHDREEDEAAALWKRLEEQQRSGQSCAGDDDGP
ncbi:uncharacterized protein MYCFIDRAFT_174333 [Pseudocercospora fijiensis CIRAD86]|uniref:Uncharacterized protein n=1 Tax=Pseudocercospora fijiensis (strain CIRAD86) TaxID=383855 RepID=M2ZUX5_PSEFD|nr:uncharacterized protein MYCFIDRAFT_174333 [Pseudocercospora fijiensis CIRAD86]EME82794.1 hypothetical protein MYCFIDRAFT_174333 [Pseudocercospora fijiensis CIRAD86]